MMELMRLVFFFYIGLRAVSEIILRSREESLRKRLGRKRDGKFVKSTTGR